MCARISAASSSVEVVTLGMIPPVLGRPTATNGASTRSRAAYLRCMDDVGAGDKADPGVAPDAALKRGRLVYTLEVDGEHFAVRSHETGTDYDWVSGPNKDYGFGTSARDMPEEWHRESIRNFLSMIDPNTGYIDDE